MLQQQVIENDQVSYFIDVIVKDLSEALQISKADSIFILTQVGWDHIQIGDLFLKYNSIDQVLINLGLSYQIQIPQINEPILCSICNTNYINIQLSCNHQCCSICLNMHIEQQLQYTSFPKCFQYQCNKIIPTNFYSHFKQFNNLVIQSVLKIKKKCGNKKCLKLIENSQYTYFIRCQCGYLNCTLCQNGDHRPLSCAQIQQKFQLFSDLTKIKSQVNSNTFAQCPKCLIQIEKISGCNQMTCKTQIGCGYIFCWICRESWKYQHKCNQNQFERFNKQVRLYLREFDRNPNTFTRIRQASLNKIPDTFKLKCQNETKNKQDLEIIENCFDFLDKSEDLSTKETIFISHNPGLQIKQFHESFQYYRFMHYKKEIFNIFKTCQKQNQQLSDIKINLLSKYYKVGNQFLDEYLDLFKQEQNQLQ